MCLVKPYAATRYVCHVQLIYGAFHKQLAAAFVAIDARPQFISSLGGTIISSYISNTPQVEVGGPVSEHTSLKLR